MSSLVKIASTKNGSNTVQLLAVVGYVQNNTHAQPSTGKARGPHQDCVGTCIFPFIISKFSDAGVNTSSCDPSSNTTYKLTSLHLIIFLV